MQNLEIMKDIQLSEHFSLLEFTKSATADKLGIKNEPDTTEIGHLRLLCVYLLEPLRQAWGSGIVITSGFRCCLLNEAVNGSRKTAHQFGYAADIVPSNGKIAEFKEFVKRFLCSTIYQFRYNGMFDQCIDERNAQGSEWLHLGLMNAKGEQRRQFLITKDGKTYKEDKV